MKKLMMLFTVAALAAITAVPALAKGPFAIPKANLSIVGGDTATTAGITVNDTVKFQLDLTGFNNRHSGICLRPMVFGEDLETGEKVEVAVGNRFFCPPLRSGRGKDAAPGSMTFTSKDLGVDFSKSNTYEFFVQVWNHRMFLGSTNTVIITAEEKPFTGVAFTGRRTSVASGGYDWTTITDGAIRVVRVLPSAYIYDGMFLTASTGIYTRTPEFDGGSITEKLITYPGIIEGHHFNPVGDGKIELGFKGEEYAFADDARVYRLDAHVGLNPEMSIEDIPYSWNGKYWVLLDSWGRIRFLFLSYTDATTPCTFVTYWPYYICSPDSTQPTEANLKQVGILKKFKTAEGPIDRKTGLSVKYAYFEPEDATADARRPGILRRLFGKKYPLMIWLHGSGGGANVWSPLVNDTGLTRFADEYQSLFSAGGAYVMVPRSNEDFAEGHGMRWNAQQVGAFFKAVDDFIWKHPEVDVNRIYVGGHSIGGGMVWSVIRERPSFFAAAFASAPPGRFMPDPQGNEIKKFASLPIWIVHSVQDTTVRVDYDSQVTPDIPWGSRPVMNALLPLAEAVGTESRLTLLHPAYYLGAHMEVTAIYNNMVNPYTNPPSFYASGDESSLNEKGEPLPVRDEERVLNTTLIDWLNRQTAFENWLRRIIRW